MAGGFHVQLSRIFKWIKFSGRVRVAIKVSVRIRVTMQVCSRVVITT